MERRARRPNTGATWRALLQENPLALEYQIWIVTLLIFWQCQNIGKFWHYQIFGKVRLYLIILICFATIIEPNVKLQWIMFQIDVKSRLGITNELASIRIKHNYYLNYQNISRVRFFYCPNRPLLHTHFFAWHTISFGPYYTYSYGQTARKQQTQIVETS